MSKIPMIVRRFLINVPTRVQQESVYGEGLEWVDGAERECEIEVVIDLAEIVERMGQRAVNNRSGRCRAGYVCVTHKKVRLKGTV